MRSCRSFAPVLLLSAAALAGCDAGNKEAQNRSAGPLLYVTNPRMDAVLTVAAKPDEKDATKPPTWPVEVTLDLRDYVVGDPKKNADGTYVSGTGQHVHVIVDDEPYLAVYDASKPVKLALKSEGTHLVRAFPSAGPADAKGAHWHESRKNDGAFAWVRFHVNKKDGPLGEFDGSRPLLTFSRPKGSYKTGDADAKLLFPLMVDFYLTHVNLGPRDDRIHVTFDGKPLTVPVVGGKEGDRTADLLEWKPYFVEGTPSVGDHTVVVELLDRDGNLVDGPFNRTERKITVTGPPK